MKAQFDELFSVNHLQGMRSSARHGASAEEGDFVLVRLKWGADVAWLASALVLAGAANQFL